MHKACPHGVRREVHQSQPRRVFPRSAAEYFAAFVESLLKLEISGRSQPSAAGTQCGTAADQEKPMFPPLPVPIQIPVCGCCKQDPCCCKDGCCCCKR